MRKWICLCLALLLPCLALAEGLPVYAYTHEGNLVAEHQSDTLWWRIERMWVRGVPSYVVKVCMVEPGRQIGKAASDWRENTMPLEKLAERAGDASLIINGSGYVNRVYSWIPENYPGANEDYFCTPLGSVTVTDGQVQRHLEGVPYYGLTLNADGLRMHVGEAPEQVLAQQPSQTWSFYVECPVILDHASILDPDWRFTNRKAMRNIICKMDENNYLILIVTGENGGLTMQQCVDFLMERYDPEWAYNLDGGPSAGLMYRKGEEWVTVWPSGQDNVDAMTFSE